MKQIIDGLRYDTETAELIGDADAGGYSASDFNYWSAGLYKTKSGRFFLAGEGGPLTSWARPIGNATGWGKGIVPMSESEALAWAEQHLGAEAVEEHFGELIKDA